MGCGERCSEFPKRERKETKCDSHTFENHPTQSVVIMQRVVIDSAALMFCPQCKAEYRPGFTRCADCKVELVDQLPEAPSPEPYESVWTGEDREGCVFACRALKALGIPFTVDQRRHQLWGSGVDEHYEIVVLSQFSSQAKAELAKGDFDFQDEDEQQRIIGFPEDDGSMVAEGPRDFKPWYPEDAIVEIYSERGQGNEDPKAWMIEAGLRENLIRSRAEDVEDGLRKVFVVPDDETRAREIVREITDGTPPA